MKTQCEESGKLTNSIMFHSTRLCVQLSDGLREPSHKIRWSWDDGLYKWADGFPELGE
jgi:hypothetical protein